MAEVPEAPDIQVDVESDKENDSERPSAPQDHPTPTARALTSYDLVRPTRIDERLPLSLVPLRLREIDLKEASQREDVAERVMPPVRRDSGGPSEFHSAQIRHKDYGSHSQPSKTHEQHERS